ncbi:MAG: bifunctional oligoribonuclease/PAP phosphatase NrnA [Bacteroidetes bacterium]|nr:bifunctional oligoribonuclease/PAP phosphatase NrnA [Bacteroidota bacterium]MBS1981279.1 bifunctional oligoribonuclease/PAP phosphatase NrnA [Bacteroidota bacterium]
MDQLAELKALLKSPQKIAIVTHFKPDADALGSSLGLAGFLKKNGHEVNVITPSDFPDFLLWMPGSHEVVAHTKKSTQPLAKATRLFQTADLIFCLDFSSLSRINDLSEIVRQAPAKKIMVDHHLQPESFADFQKWNVSAASTAQLIFELIEELDGKSSMDAGIASCLYAGLMTDTGSFRHNNTTARELAIAAELVLMGANPSEIARLIYDVNSLSKLRLVGYALSQKLVVIPEYNTAYITLSQDELKKLDAQTGDTEGLVNYGLSIKGIQLAVLMYDRGEEIKISFRSLGDFSVNELARKHFEGGGHKNASGGSSKLSLEETLKKFLDLLPEYKKKLLNHS